MDINELLAQLANILGFKTLKLNENNKLQIRFNDVVVTLEHLGEELYIFSLLEDASHQDKLKVFSYLLETNSYFRGTFGGIIGIEPNLQTITFTHKFNLQNITASVLATTLEKHVELVEVTQMKLMFLD